MASLQRDFESTLNLGSDSDDTYVTEIEEQHVEDLMSKVGRYLCEKKKPSAFIVHKEGKPAQLMISLGRTNAKLGCKESMRTKSTKKLLVKNVPTKSDKEHLQMFFEYEKGQGGGPVKQVTLNVDQSAIVEFEEARSVDVVLQKAPIKMLGEVVEVKAFVPYLEAGEVIDSICVDGLPVALSKEIEVMSLEQRTKVQREVKEGDRVRVKRSVQNPRYTLGRITHESVGTVQSFDKDKFGRCKVSVDLPNNPGWHVDPEEMEIVDYIIPSLISKDQKENIICTMDDVRGDFLGPPHGTTPAAVIGNKI